jgi:hypothetical protein
MSLHVIAQTWKSSNANIDIFSELHDCGRDDLEFGYVQLKVFCVQSRNLRNG